MGRRWVVAALAVVALAAAGCSTSGAVGGGDPRDVLVAGAEPLAGGGSARARATFSLPGAQGQDVASEGVVSWRGAGGSTGELTLPSIMGGGQQSRALFTEDALYIDAGSLGSLSGRVPGLAGKQWIKQSYADVERDLGPIGKVLTAAIDRTNPVRSAALLVQSPDLREVGEEQMNGVATTHYAGTIRFTDAVEDLRLGLDRQVLDELRREFAAQGLTDAQQYDLWVDDQGRPVRAQGRVTDAVGPESYTVDYSDYGPPRTVQAPPADQVVDKGQLTAGLGGFGN